METSVKDQLKKLVEIQKLDGEIYDLNQDAQEKPKLIDQLKDEFEATKAHLNELEEQAKGILVTRKEFELDLKTKEDLIAKGNTDLSQIKTNKEYTAKVGEIEGVKADKSIIEDKILNSYDDADKINEDIESEKKVVAEREKEFQTKKKEVEDEVKVIKDRIGVLQGQRNQLAPDIEKSTLSMYDKLLAHKEGRAIVPVKGTSCGGCYMNVMAQTINLIKSHTELVQCEYCSRILYLEEDL